MYRTLLVILGIDVKSSVISCRSILKCHNFLASQLDLGIAF